MPYGWKFNMHATPQAQNQSAAKTFPSPTPNLEKDAEIAEADEEDTAAPLVDWPGAVGWSMFKKDGEKVVDWKKLWKEAMTKEEMNEYGNGVNNTKKLSTDWGRIWREGMAKTRLAVEAENGKFFRPPSPMKSSFTAQFIQFSDGNPGCKITNPSPTKSSSMMLTPAEPTAETVKDDRDWEIIDHDEAEEPWKVLDGTLVENDWDFVLEAKRFRMDGLETSANQRMRMFFEAEKVRRECERTKVRELACKENENL